MRYMVFVFPSAARVFFKWGHAFESPTGHLRVPTNGHAILAAHTISQDVAPGQEGLHSGAQACPPPSTKKKKKKKNSATL